MLERVMSIPEFPILFLTSLVHPIKKTWGKETQPCPLFYKLFFDSNYEGHGGKIFHYKYLMGGIKRILFLTVLLAIGLRK
jgi:hypothetical protein